MHFQYAIVTTNGSPDHECFRFHVGWKGDGGVYPRRLKGSGGGETFHLEGVFAFERNMEDYSVYMVVEENEVKFVVKDFDAHLRPNAVTPIFTFHKDGGAWVCEEEWPAPQEKKLHDVVPHGGRGLDALEQIVAHHQMATT